MKMGSTFGMLFEYDFFVYTVAVFEIFSLYTGH